ncbi:MAG: hypothetical protein AAF184_19510 [Pseudomonadota bacterium]
MLQNPLDGGRRRGRRARWWLALATISIASAGDLPATASAPQEIHLAAAAIGGYRNVIPRRSFPLDFTEVCLVRGSVAFDVHDAEDHTRGGNCEPGDPGWVIAREAFAPSGWREAEAICGDVGMRLPRVIEWQMSCRHAERAELQTIEDTWEWAQNAARDTRRATRRGAVRQVPGEAICRDAQWNYVATFGSDKIGERGFRCAH